MKLAISCDHAGYELKTKLIDFLRKNGNEILDLGTCDSVTPVDYPDFAQKAAMALKEKQAERAIVICGSGVGASIAANKFKGIRAAICHDTYSARQGVEHDDMNILCLGARIIGEELAKEIVLSFSKAIFSKEERHIRRLKKVLNFEEKGL